MADLREGTLPLFSVKKEEMIDGRKASRASKSTPLLSSRFVSTTDYYKLPQARQSYAHVFHVFNKSCFPMLSSLNYGTCWFYLSLIWKFELNTSLSSIKLRIVVFLQLTLNSSLKRFCSDQLQSTLNWSYILILLQLLVTLVEYPMTFFIQFLRSMFFCITQLLKIVWLLSQIFEIFMFERKWHV